MGYTRDKSVLFAIVLALLTVSAAFIIMTDHEDSKAVDYNDDIHVAKIGNNGYETLKAAFDAAKKNDVIVVTKNIVLKDRLYVEIYYDNITLTTVNDATISAAENFNVINGWADNNLIDIKMMVAGSSQFNIGEANTDNEAKDNLTLDGNGKCRVIRFVRGTGDSKLVLNKGHITDGFGLIGGGIFLSYGANFDMNGGIVKGNNVDPAWASTDYKYSADLLLSAGTDARIYGGEVGSMFHRADKKDTGYRTEIHGGTIDNVYIHSYPNGNGSTFTYYKTNNPATVGNAYLATLGHNNDTDTFDCTRIYPFEDGVTLKPGDHVAKNERTKIGYRTLQDAINAAEEEDTIIILSDMDFTTPNLVGKDVKFKIAPNYETVVNAKGEYGAAPKVNGEFPSVPFNIEHLENLLINIKIDLNGGTMELPTGWTNNGRTYSAYHGYGTLISDIVNGLEAPVRTGYKFTGWSYTDGAIGTVSANITANYTVNSYKIHLHHGTDGFSHGTATVDFDSDSVLIHEIPKKIGHRLVGYFTHETDGTMVLNADGTFASDNVDDHITDGKWSKAEHHTLYAQWELDESSNINPMIIIIATAMEAAIVIGVTALIRRR